MNSFYTNVQVQSGKILYRGIENGIRVKKRVDYYPTLFLPSTEPTEYRTIDGQYVSAFNPGSITDCREHVKLYDGVSNYTIYGNQKYEYQFISDAFPKTVPWSREHIRVCNIDIEVGSENGFPEPDKASEEITAITMKIGSKFMVFGCGDFNNTRKDVLYIKCDDERDLIKRFMLEWSYDYPDIITGWNVKYFDIPYIINRIRNVFGEDDAKRFSPWNRISEQHTIVMGKDKKALAPVGIAVLDYFELYKKYAPGGTTREDYKLGTICEVEIKEKKLSYEEYGNLHTLYRDNYQLFIEYNIRDVELIDRLDAKLKLIDLALHLAYDSKSNYEDVFKQVRMWDALTYNRLKAHNIVVPPSRKGEKDSSYVGAYVKDVQVGLHKWVVSFDLDSLYPHLIMQFNISPDSFIEPTKYNEAMKTITSQNIDIQTVLNKQVDTISLKSEQVTLTPNGQLFDISRKGFLAEMMQEMYDDRKKYKKQAIEGKKLLEKETDPTKRAQIENDIAKNNNLQMAKKVCLNSAYGALGSEYFRFYDVRQATAITTSGQVAIQWIGNRLNTYLNRLLKTNNKDYVIASDTDSVYLCLDELVRQTFDSESTDTNKIIDFLDKVCEAKLQPFIDKSYDELAEYLNSLDQKMHMKREVLADKGIWTAKKRYILNVYDSEGVRYSKPQIKISGLEMVKSSTPPAVKKKLKESLDIIINGNNDDLIAFIDDFRDTFKKLPLGDIAFPRGASSIDSFVDEETANLYIKGTPIHVKGCIVFNNMLKKHKLLNKYRVLKEGDKIKFIYLKEPNYARSPVISFSDFVPPEFDLNKDIDYNTQFEKSFLSPLRIILDVIGWKTETVNNLLGLFS